MNRIDFCGIIVAEKCNPNGDPLNGNMPRQDFSGHGIMSDVCLKRKIRDRLYDNGHDIFVVRQENLKDDNKSLKDRVTKNPELKDAMKKKDDKLFFELACQKWIDVRAFGQVFAFTKDGSGVSESVRGPVSIGQAVSLDVVNILNVGITKSVNTNDAKGESAKASDTMASRYMIDRGAYVFRGSIYPQLAEKTFFTYKDAMAIKDAILHMFQNDISQCRPSGSMTLDKLYWWEHNCPTGQYSPIKVFHSLHLEPTDTYPYYTDSLEELPGLEAEICEGW